MFKLLFRTNGVMPCVSFLESCLNGNLYRDSKHTDLTSAESEFETFHLVAMKSSIKCSRVLSSSPSEQNVNLSVGHKTSKLEVD